LLVTREPAFANERRLVAADAKLTALDERSPNDGFTFCGVTLADADLPARLPQTGPSCLIRQGFLPFLDRLPVRLVETAGFFADTGTPESLVDAHHRGLTWAKTLPPPLTRVTSRGISPG
jgi:NDP-sugar pyrophosphorylase family protein